jgi:hypothetical protein
LAGVAGQQLAELDEIYPLAYKKVAILTRFLVKIYRVFGVSEILEGRWVFCYTESFTPNQLNPEQGP